MPVQRQESDESSLQLSTTAWKLVEIFIAETLGTGMLLFFGCMGLITWEDVPLPPYQGAVVFAVVVATIIQIFGHITAAHLNPAVTVAFVVLGQVTPYAGFVYIFAECIGAILGFGLLKLITPYDIFDLSESKYDDRLCSTIPHYGMSDAQALAAEFLATSFLVFVVCSCVDRRNADKGDSNPLKFAATIFALSVTIGPYTGASMNPARTLGPAVWNGEWTKHWIYWLGPISSGFMTAAFYQIVFDRKPIPRPPNVEDVPLTGLKSQT